MFRHKSLGLLTGIIVAPRLGYRMFNAAKVCTYLLDFVRKNVSLDFLAIHYCTVSNWSSHRDWSYWSKTRRCIAFLAIRVHDHNACYGYCHGVLRREGIVSSIISLILLGFWFFFVPFVVVRVSNTFSILRPFFWTTIPGATQANGDIAKKVSNSVHRSFDACLMLTSVYIISLSLIKHQRYHNQELLHS